MLKVQMPTISGQYYSKPIVLGGAQVPVCNNPEGLAGTEEGITRRANEHYHRMLGATIVVPTTLERFNGVRALSEAISEMGKRVGQDQPFFILSDNGYTLHIASLRHLKTIGYFQVVGGLRQEQILMLDQVVDHFAVPNKNLTSQFSALLRNAQGFVINGGAGADYQTIGSLKRDGGLIMSYDVAPGFQPRAVQHQATPYIFALPCPEVLVPVFQPAEGTKEYFLKNVLSNLSVDEMRLLFETGNKLGLNQITIIQTLGIAKDSNLIGDIVRNGFANYCEANTDFDFVRGLVGRKSDTNYITACRQIINFAAIYTFDNLYTEFMVQHFLEEAKKAGYIYRRVINIESSHVMDKQKGESYLDRNFKQHLGRFAGGELNHIQMTPFLFRGRRGWVPEGGLKLTRGCFCIQVSKEPLNELTGIDPTVDVQEIKPESLQTPFISQSCTFQLDGDHIPIDWQSKIDNNAFNSLANEGTRIALNFIEREMKISSALQAGFVRTKVKEFKTQNGISTDEDNPKRKKKN